MALSENTLTRKRIPRRDGVYNPVAYVSYLDRVWRNGRTAERNGRTADMWCDDWNNIVSWISEPRTLDKRSVIRQKRHATESTRKTDTVDER